MTLLHEPRRGAERPILFSAPMVRAILDDWKSQTRRALRDQQPVGLGDFAHGAHFIWRPVWDRVAQAFASKRHVPVRCPYGEPRDHLWVKETFFAFGRWETRFNPKKGRDEWHFVDLTRESGRAYMYTADPTSSLRLLADRKSRGELTPAWWKRPAIFMPRVASRITLEVTDVRVERLQAISAADAIAEGLIRLPASGRYVVERGEQYAGLAEHSPILVYRRLWESINGAGSWKANPWVWVVEFRRVA